MENEDNEELTQVDISTKSIILSDEEDNGSATLYSNHGIKVLLMVKKGKLKGQSIYHFKCSYCRDKHFQGPSSTALLEHLRNVHPTKCPELLPHGRKAPKDFFNKAKKMLPFDKDVFMGKLLKWIIRTDQSFSVVDNEDFGNLLNYLKKDITLNSRRTIMRRLEELYLHKQTNLKEKLKGFHSKYSITCDVWTSKNQLYLLTVSIIVNCFSQ
jgi:hypothetical protein